MPRVFAQMAVTLDGFIAGPDDGPEHPIGIHTTHHGGRDAHPHRVVASPAVTHIRYDLG